MNNASHTSPDEQFDDLDARFAAASDELRNDLARIDPPPLTDPSVDPKRSNQPMLLAAAALVLVVIAAGLVMLIPDNDEAVTISAPMPTPTLPLPPETAVGGPAGTDTVPSPDGGVPNEAIFGADAMRLTASTPSEYILPVQAPAAAWNADGTRLLLYRTTAAGDGGHVLIDLDDDGRTGAPTTLDIVPSDIEEVYWSPVDPDVFFFVVGKSLISFNVSAKASVVERTFEECDTLDPGNGTGPSWDGALIGLLCTGETNRLVAYQLATGDVVTAPTNGDQAPIVLPSGGGFLLPVSGGPDLVLDRGLAPTGVALDLDDATRAMTMVDGVDVIVGPSFDGDIVGSLVAYPADGSEPYVIIGPTTGFPSPPGGSSVSATAWSEPGRVAVAFATGDPDSPLDGRIIVADLGTAQVDVVATHLASGRIDYWSDTFVSIDPSGTKLAFSTDRGEAIAVDTYVLEIER